MRLTNIHINSLRMNLRPHVGPIETMSSSDEEAVVDSDPKAVYILSGLLCINCIVSLVGRWSFQC